ncbi:putative transmembrane protein 244 [Paramormyrops kingsleyae]|uniref:putative transmembrane protein 244 n=1 Tax=Paramormyrops kingsleyae TaxID=1676925 RepID=UPI003B96CEBF
MFLDYWCRCCGATLIKRLGQTPTETKTEETWVVLWKLLICLGSFYSLYYITVSLCVGFLRLEDVNIWLVPFDFTIQDSWENPEYLVSVISTEVTYLLSGLLFGWLVDECMWDYAITVTLIHVGFTVAVMSDFPSAEHWWAALGSGLLMMICTGQLLAYRLLRSNFVHPADLQNF